MKKSTFKMVPIQIGGVVDFIDTNVRMRGIVLCISQGLATLGVVGSLVVFVKPVDDLAAIRDSTAILDVLRA